jgi:hypothetical protein
MPSQLQGENMKWTSTGFTSLLRCLVLLFSFFISNAQAAISYQLYNPSTSSLWQGTTSYSSKEAACTALMHARLDVYAASYPVHVMNYTMVANAMAQYPWLPAKEGCKVELFVNGNMGGAYQTFVGYFVTGVVCSADDPHVPVNMWTQLLQNNPIIFDGAQIPATYCHEGCLANLDVNASKTNGTFGCRQNTGFGNINTIGSAVKGDQIQCLMQYKPTATTCTVPTCTPPQELNQFGQCQTPACPAGQARASFGAACTPIVCTPPMVKEGNSCVIPKCPSGQVYKYENGAGSCVRDQPICVPPTTLVGNQCIDVPCPAGMIKDNGVCKPNPANNTSNNSGTNSTNKPTLNDSTGTTTSTPTPKPDTATGASNNPTDKPATSTNTKPTTGTSTNTGDSGLCKTPPCGNCDPATQTCGNTFGGSCDSDFKCNGDAIQCAVALATNKQECATASLKIEKDNQPILDEGKKAIDDGTKALGTTGGIGVTNGNAITINSSNPYTSQCPADYYLATYKGTELKIPLSKYCNIFEIMGNIILLAASLISMKIIMKTEG